MPEAEDRGATDADIALESPRPPRNVTSVGALVVREASLLVVR